MAVGVELLHTASLVHDDIVDESDTRHGGATLYAKVGNALAVLVGDYLFSQAAKECVATGNLQVVRLFAETLGAMAQGQIDDANGQLGGRHVWATLSRERYFRTITGKTASLFVLACQGTGLLVELDEAQVDGAAALRRRIWAWPSRWSTTSSTSPAPRRSWASRLAATCARGRSRCR